MSEKVIIGVLRFISTKDLKDVGKELPTRAGELEANKDKNRYPYVLPCKFTKCVKVCVTLCVCGLGGGGGGGRHSTIAC